MTAHRRRLHARYVLPLVLAAVGAACGAGTEPGPPGPVSAVVTVRTSGSTPDPDGYTLQLNDGAPVSLTGTATRTLEGPGAAANTVALGGLAPNCEVAGDNPAPVAADGTVRFDVECLRPLRNQILYIRHGRGISGPPDELRAIGSDGSNDRLLYRSEHPDQRDISGVSINPAGTRVALTVPGSPTMLSVLTLETGVVDVVAFPAWPGETSWSADGRQLLFDGPDAMLHVMSRAGGESRSLGVSGNRPRWSPDGRRIVYEWNNAIRTIRPDGSDQRSVTVGHYPVWSSDGRELAYIDHGRAVLIIRSGESLEQVREVLALDASPVSLDWSRTGSRLAFVSLRVVDNGSVHLLETVNADGTGRTLLVGPTPTEPAPPAISDAVWTP